jgi:hypothetical protein
VLHIYALDDFQQGVSISDFRLGKTTNANGPGIREFGPEHATKTPQKEYPAKEVSANSLR